MGKKWMLKKEEAQFRLGYKHYFGDQVNRNRDSFKYWLNKSAKNAHENARKTYDAFFKIIPSLKKKDSVK
jgi:TPR repeat protein